MTNKIALVTGGSKGLGAAVAVALASDGFDIWLNYRGDHTSASAVKASVENTGSACTLLPFDVSDSAEVIAALEPLVKENAPFVVVNNAGFAKDGILAMMSDSEWHGVLDVHLNGFFNVTKYVLPHMLRKRQGRIINMVSTSGESGVAGQVNYSAAKAGLIGATKALAKEVAKRNILVNAVSPGFIATDMTADLPEDKILPLIPLGRMGQPEEVAGLVRFLCSSSAGYITGQVFAVNGGVYM